MLYVSVNYNYSPNFKTSESWIQRTRGYTGILESLAVSNKVIAIKQIDVEGNYVHNGVEHHFVDFGKKKTNFPFKLNSFVKNLNPEVIILQGLHQPLQFLLLRLILKKDVKIIAQHHAEKPFTGLKKTVQKLADKYIYAYLFASKTMGIDWVNQGVINSTDKIHEVMEVSSIFYPIEKSAAIAQVNINGSPIFLWVGRLNANKDPLNIVAGFLMFAHTVPSAKLYMIYHTDELLPNILELINDHPYKDNITLIGKIPNDDLLYWYNTADFIISGSFYEGSGTAICEAISCGCVPVVTDIPSFRMITNNGKCGILYEAGNTDALFKALMQTIDLNVEEKRLLCFSYFDSHLSFDAIAGRISAIANSLFTE